MEHISRAAGHDNLFVKAILTTNKNQKKRFAQKIIDKLGKDVAGSTVAVWGLAFKADTDDIRESAAIDVIQHLLDSGVRVKATDPKGMDHMRKVFGDKVEWCIDPVRAAAGADAVAIVTDWLLFETIDFGKLKAVMNQPVIFDGRNCLSREDLRKHGFRYYPMGRPSLDAEARTIASKA